MKTRFIVACVVGVLLAASTGVGFWMLNGSKAELADTKAALTDAQVDLASAEAELTSTIAALNSSKAENTGLNETLTVTRARMELINGVFVPVMKGELDGMTENELGAWFLGWQGGIEDVGDPILEEKWQVFLDSDFSDAAATSFFLYLFESTAEALD